MTDPTDDQYAEREYRDRTDFMGSSDASLEMGVTAVIAWAVCWFFVKWLFWPVVLASLAILAWRVCRGQTVPGKLWERIRALPGKAIHAVRSTKIVFEIRRVPEEVLDVTLLRDSLFVVPPTCVEHQQTRDAFVRVAAMKPVFGVAPSSDEYEARNRYMLLLASTIAQLEYWGDDPLGPIRERRWKPPTAPQAAPVTQQPLAGVSGIASLPIPGVGWLSQYLMVALVIVGSFGVWQMNRANDNAVKLKTARADARAWQQSSLDNAKNAETQATRRAQETATALAEAEKSRAIAENAQARARRLAAREKKANEDASSGLPADLDQRLRERLAEPAAAAEPSAAGAGESGGPG
jgi:hypothetical protein